MTSSCWTRRSVSRRRRIVLGTVALFSTLATGAAMVPSAGVSAQYVATSDVVIAERAADALESLDKWQRSGRTSDLNAYTEARAVTARMTAYAVHVPGSKLEAEWASSDLSNQHVVLAALTQLDVPYRSMASKQDVGFDCSGLTMYAFAEAGIEIPRSSRQQIDAAAAVTEVDAEPGDLVYYPGHVSLYIGAGLLVHSPQSGQTVEVRHLFDRSLRFGDATR
jgi:cell wall-associated NlpC family hydrolase